MSCDGVGTHLGYSVVMKALELGLEILLQVPHLSYALQEEDTVNFKELNFIGARANTKLHGDKLFDIYD